MITFGVSNQLLLKLLNKTVILIALIFISGRALSQTTVYHEFPDSNAFWNVQYIASWGCGPPFFNSLYLDFTYLMDGDTVINGLTYQKLTTPFIQASCAFTPFFPTGYRGAVREDIAARKVYFVYPGTAIDSLLYDFSMEVGDTLRGILAHDIFQGSGNCYNDLSIHEIDSVLIGGSYRKRWLIDQSMPLLIEGIGSTTGFLEEICWVVIEESGFQLTCFVQNGVTLYPDGATNCAVITAVNDGPATGFSLTVAPHPLVSESVLSFPNAQGELFEFTLRDIAGRVIETLETHAEKLIIKKEKKTAGLYLFTLTNLQTGARANGKVLVEE